MRTGALVAGVLALGGTAAAQVIPAPVDEGCLPRLVRSSDGTLALLYVKGSPRGDLHLRTSADGGSAWGKPLKVLEQVYSGRESSWSFPSLDVRLGRDDAIYVMSDWGGVRVCRLGRAGAGWEPQEPGKPLPDAEDASLWLDEFTGTIWVAYRVARSRGRVEVVSSRDAGRTWSAPERVRESTTRESRAYPTMALWRPAERADAPALPVCFVSAGGDGIAAFARTAEGWHAVGPTIGETVFTHVRAVADDVGRLHLFYAPYADAPRHRLFDGRAISAAFVFGDGNADSVTTDGRRLWVFGTRSRGPDAAEITWWHYDGGDWHEPAYQVSEDGLPYDQVAAPERVPPTAIEVPVAFTELPGAVRVARVPLRPIKRGWQRASLGPGRLYPNCQRRLVQSYLPERLCLVYAADNPGSLVARTSVDGGASWRAPAVLAPSAWHQHQVSVAAWNDYPEKHMRTQVYVVFRGGCASDGAAGIYFERLPFVKVPARVPGIEVGRAPQPIVRDPRAANPFVGRFADGVLHVAYATRGGEATEVVVRASSDDGRSWRPVAALRAEEFTDPERCFPAVLEVGGGGIVLIGTETGLWWARCDGAVPQRLYSTAVLGDYSATVDDDGRLHVVYAGPEGAIAWRHFDGKVWSAPEVLVASEARHPSVTTDGKRLWCVFVQPNPLGRWDLAMREAAAGVWAPGVRLLAAENLQFGWPNAPERILPSSPGVPVVWMNGTEVRYASVPVKGQSRPQVGESARGGRETSPPAEQSRAVQANDRSVSTPSRPADRATAKQEPCQLAAGWPTRPNVRTLLGDGTGMLVAIYVRADGRPALRWSTDDGVAWQPEWVVDEGRLPRSGCHLAGALWRRHLVVAYGGHTLAARALDLERGARQPPAAPTLIPARHDAQLGFPAMTVDARGRLWLAYHSWCAYTRGDLYIRSSADGGRTWSEPLAGKLDCTGDHGTGCVVGLGRWRGHPVFWMDGNDGDGMFWRPFDGYLFNPLKPVGTINGQFERYASTEDDAGRLHLLFSHYGGWLFHTVYDGRAWSAPDILAAEHTGFTVTSDGQRVYAIWAAKGGLVSKTWQAGRWDAAAPSAIANAAGTEPRVPERVRREGDAAVVPLAWSAEGTILFSRVQIPTR